MPEALATLGYGAAEIEEIVRYAVGHGTLKGAPGVNHESLKRKGFDEAALKRLEEGLAGAFDIKFAFNKFALGAEFCTGALKIRRVRRASIRCRTTGASPTRRGKSRHST